MKKLLLLVGMTGVLALVSVGTRADAAEKPTTTTQPMSPEAPQDNCDGVACRTDCEAAGCFVGACVPFGGNFVCECFNENGTRCTE